jgi:hypothetical protein
LLHHPLCFEESQRKSTPTHQEVFLARVAVITEYAANYDAMTDEMANDLSKRALKAQDDRLGLYKKYHGKFAKAMSPIMAGRWLQTEAAINTMIDVQIASEMPLMH